MTARRKMPIIAGIGFRAGADVTALMAALDLALAASDDGLEPDDLDGIATIDHKAESPQFVMLAQMLGVAITAIPAATIAHQSTPTQSPRQQAAFGTGSLCEAAALICATEYSGHPARLLVSRQISPCGMATAALAKGQNP